MIESKSLLIFKLQSTVNVHKHRKEKNRCFAVSICMFSLCLFLCHSRIFWRCLFTFTHSFIYNDPHAPYLYMQHSQCRLVVHQTDQSTNSQIIMFDMHASNGYSKFKQLQAIPMNPMMRIHYNVHWQSPSNSCVSDDCS